MLYFFVCQLVLINYLSLEKILRTIQIYVSEKFQEVLNIEQNIRESFFKIFSSTYLDRRLM